jgi:hypothetical protein
LLPGARETFAAVLGEEEVKKEPAKKAVAAPPSKLKITVPPAKVTKEEKPVEKKIEPEPEKPILKAQPELALAPPPPLSPPPPPISKVVEEPEEKKSDEKAGAAEKLSLQFSLEEACRTMESVAQAAVGAGDPFLLIFSVLAEKNCLELFPKMS